MEAQELTWNSDHLPQALIDQVLASIKTEPVEQTEPLDLSGTNPAQAIVISSSTSEDNDYDSVDLMTEESWDEFFVAGEGPLDPMAIPVAETRNDACVACVPGSKHLSTSSMECERATLPSHGLRIWNKSPHLSCTKCCRPTDGCLTDRQIRSVSFRLMPELYANINRKCMTDMETMVQLRMIVRLYALKADGFDKIGLCLLEELTGLDPDDRLVILRLDGNHDQ